MNAQRRKETAIFSAIFQGKRVAQLHIQSNPPKSIRGFPPNVSTMLEIFRENFGNNQTQGNNMRIGKLKTLLIQAINAKMRVLVKGKPGVGKSDIWGEVARETNHKLLLFHGSIADPTDVKGFPSKGENGQAIFLPYAQMWEMVNAKEPTICLFEDLGQAPRAVQAAIMQIVLARECGGHKIADCVTFAGATNETGQNAGVDGMIEPLKSRWNSIILAEENVEDWADYASKKGLDYRLIAFLRTHPQLLCDFKPTKEIINTPNPRNWESVAKWLAIGVDDTETLSGAVGNASAVQLSQYLGMVGSLPPIREIFANPTTTFIPTELGAQYAVCAGIAKLMDASNIGAGMKYLSRMDKTFEVVAILDATKRNVKLTESNDFIRWASNNRSALGC